MTLAHEAPFVSVIVPVYNDRARIVRCIEAVLGQVYQRSRYEVIVVDNGSTDGTPSLVARQPVSLLQETGIRSSYAARNRGLREARGAVIAFTDADCTPAPRWLEAGVCALETHHADLAGGAVRFVASAKPSGAEIYDAITNMQQERSIRERGAAKTANLFARAAVFETIGPFPPTAPSGGDVSWTTRATRHGFRLIYVPEAEVAHPTRRFLALLGKQYRVGRGRYRLAIEARELPHIARPPAQIRLAVLRAQAGRLRPPPIGFVRQGIERCGMPVTRARLARVWAAGWASSVSTAIGIAAESFRSDAE